MLSDIQHELLDYKLYLEKIRSLARKQMTEAPEGSLEISRYKGKPRFYRTKNGSRKYIQKKEMNTIRDLAQKSYAVSVFRKTNTQISLISSFLEYFDSEIFKGIHEQLAPERFDLIIPYEIDDDSFLMHWLHQPYEGNSYKLEEKNICTNNNELVRSKGEKILADKLRDMGIPYKYECPLELKGYGRIYPDFTIMNMKVREEIYIELFGMMDTPDYCANALKKIETYEKHHIYPGKNLVCLFESSKKTFDTAVFEQVLRNLLK